MKWQGDSITWERSTKEKGLQNNLKILNLGTKTRGDFNKVVTRMMEGKE